MTSTGSASQQPSVIGLWDIPAEDRALLRGLIAGTSVEDMAWSAARPAAELLGDVHEIVRRTAPELAADVEPDIRDRVTDYLLGTQSPGQAAGTVELLESSREARSWAIWVRTLVGPYYRGEAPEIPGVSPPRSDGGGDGSAPRRRPPVSARRAARRKRDEEERARGVLATMGAMFRPEAVEHHRRGEEAIRLPQFSSRPALFALWALLAALGGVLAFALLVRAPYYVTAPAVATRSTASGDQLTAIVLFPPALEGKLRPGGKVQLSFAGGGGTLPARIERIDPAPSTANQIVSRFDLSGAAAATVRGPAVVATALLPSSARLLTGAVGSGKYRAGTEQVINLVSL